MDAARAEEKERHWNGVATAKLQYHRIYYKHRHTLASRPWQPALSANGYYYYHFLIGYLVVTPPRLVLLDIGFYYYRPRMAIIHIFRYLLNGEKKPGKNVIDKTSQMDER